MKNQDLFYYDNIIILKNVVLRKIFFFYSEFLYFENLIRFIVLYLNISIYGKNV